MEVILYDLRKGYTPKLVEREQTKERSLIFAIGGMIGVQCVGETLVTYYQNDLLLSDQARRLLPWR